MALILLYLMIFAGVVGAWSMVQDTWRKNRRFVWTAVPCATLFLYGWVAFLVQGAASCGGLRFLA